MIKYRPHRGTLDDAMKEYQEFDSVSDMLRHIEEKSDGMISASDLSIRESIGADYRIGWKSTRYICTKRFGPQYFNTPTCIGMCDLGEKEGDKNDFRKCKYTKGEWIITAEDNNGIHKIQCPFCRYEKGSDFMDYITVTFEKLPPFCESCGADMRGDANGL